jgi:hypothetical protein
MIGAAIYILKPPKHRRELLFDPNTDWRAPGEPVVAEPIPRFTHSKRAPLIVLASFKGRSLTHMADGRKGALVHEYTVGCGTGWLLPPRTIWKRRG